MRIIFESHILNNTTLNFSKAFDCITWPAWHPITVPNLVKGLWVQTGNVFSTSAKCTAAAEIVIHLKTVGTIVRFHPTIR